MKLKRPLLLLIGLCWCSSLIAKPLVFGVVPQQSAKKMAALWTPFLNHVSELSGQQLVFATAKNIPTFEQRLAQGQYDLAYMNPYHFVVFHDSVGYQALVKQQDKRIRGILVARRDSAITSLSMLADKTLAFPAPAAFAASILPQAELDAAGIPFEVQYVSSHDSVYLNVAKGFFAAGGGVMRTFDNAPAGVREQLKVVWTTQPYTPHAIAAHPRVSLVLSDTFVSAFVEAYKTPTGRALLHKINMQAFEPAQNSDWDDVRQLGIPRLIYDGEE